MTSPTHHLYLDDSGTKEYLDDPAGYGSGVSRYFCFGGPLLTNAEASRLVRAIKQLKEATFGTRIVEIKSNWLRIPREQERRYLQPFGIDQERLRNFVDAFYGLVQGADLMFLAGVVDKVHMQADYKKPWYTHAVAYEIVLQRVQMELAESAGASVSVTIDDMDGATPAANQYRDLLTRLHGQLKRNGSNLLRNHGPFVFDRVKGLAFRDSAASDLLQVADIAAYNVMRQFRDNGEEWETVGLEQLPTYEHFNRLVPKFRRGPNDVIAGFGVVKFPQRERIQWRGGNPGT